MIVSPYRITGPALISFSGGRTSGYMLKQILDAHGGALPRDVFVAFMNTGKEFEQTLAFVSECSSRWEVPIVWLEFDPSAEWQTKIVDFRTASRRGEPFEAVIASKGGMLPNPVTRFCSVEMKIRRAYHYMHHIRGHDRWLSVVGLRADEPRRVLKQEARNQAGKERFTTLMPLYPAGVTKRDVSAWWAEQPFTLGLPDVGGTTPLGNCDLCFLKRAALRQRIMVTHPETAKWWIEREAEAQSRVTGTVIRKESVKRFRMDTASYAELFEAGQRQGDFLDQSAQGEEESLDCACTE